VIRIEIGLGRGEDHALVEWHDRESRAVGSIERRGTDQHRSPVGIVALERLRRGGTVYGHVHSIGPGKAPSKGQRDLPLGMDTNFVAGSLGRCDFGELICRHFHHRHRATDDRPAFGPSALTARRGLLPRDARPLVVHAYGASVVNMQAERLALELVGPRCRNKKHCNRAGLHRRSMYRTPQEHRYSSFSSALLIQPHFGLLPWGPAIDLLAIAVSTSCAAVPCGPRWAGGRS